MAWTLLALTVGCRPTPGRAPGPAVAGPLPGAAATFDSAWSIIARSHWDTTYNGVNWVAVRDSLRPKASAATSDAALRAVLTSMVGALKQSHFSIIPREATQEPAVAGGAGDLSGSIGVGLRYVEGAVVVTDVTPGGPADRAGIQQGWAIDAVNQQTVAARLAQLPPEEEPRHYAFAAARSVLRLLAGPVGERVQVTVRDGANHSQPLTVTRAPEAGRMVQFLNLPPQPALLQVERVAQGGKRIGIIRFNVWMPALSAPLDSAIDTLRDMDGIILDVRGNPGGVGAMSMGLAGHFVDSAKVIGTMHQRGATVHFLVNPRRVDTQLRPVTPYAGPLALLVDEMSASTTEIFAAGLQTMGRARVFGAQTAGMALPSVAEKLPNGDLLYHAVADFVSPTGVPLEGPGVRPDVSTPLSRGALLAGRDVAREAALAWLVRPTTP